jgi:peroxiredoxin
MPQAATPPAVGERAPSFTGLCCDGETFRTASLEDVVDGGAVLVFYGFTDSAVARNWWRRYRRRGWGEFDVPVVGVSRDGPYAQNRFLRALDLPFRLFADVNGAAVDTYGLTTRRDDMAGVETARRAVFVLDGERTVAERWVAEDWLTPPPADDVEAAVASL